jgi:hypothetical protein
MLKWADKNTIPSPDSKVTQMPSTMRDLPQNATQTVGHMPRSACDKRGLKDDLPF